MGIRLYPAVHDARLTMAGESGQGCLLKGEGAGMIVCKTRHHHSCRECSVQYGVGAAAIAPVYWL